MIKVCVHKVTSIPLWRQFPVKDNFVIGNCEFTFDENDEYDYWVAFTNVWKPQEVKVPKERRIFFYGEAPFILKYTKAFLSQFGHVYGCDPAYVKNGVIEKRNVSLFPWMVGISQDKDGDWSKNALYFNELEVLNIDQPLNKACLISSNKVGTKGHNDRVRFVDRLLKDGVDFIDVYGNGYKPFGDKLELYKKYKYAVVIENGKCPDYWTEKIADVFLTGVYPFYHGCPNINEYFDKNSMTLVDINNYEETLKTIKSLIDSDVHSTSKQALRMAKKRVMNDYNLFEIMAREIENIDKSEGTKDKKCKIIIYPSKNGSVFNRIIRKINTTYYEKKRSFLSHV